MSNDYYLESSEFPSHFDSFPITYELLNTHHPKYISLTCFNVFLHQKKKKKSIIIFSISSLSVLSPAPSNLHFILTTLSLIYRKSPMIPSMASLQALFSWMMLWQLLSLGFYTTEIFLFSFYLFHNSFSDYSFSCGLNATLPYRYFSKIKRQKFYFYEESGSVISRNNEAMNLTQIYILVTDPAFLPNSALNLLRLNLTWLFSNIIHCL